MRRLVFALVIILFFIPFFWLKPGFVDLGGDSGRLQFVDPFYLAKNLYENQTFVNAPVYSRIPYLLFISVLARIFATPTLLIAADHGIELSLAFFGMYLAIYELLRWQKETKHAELSSVLGACAYVVFISGSGWVTSLETQNQVFLNPLIFYFLARLVMTSRLRYAGAILLSTVVYSFNFGYSAAPQLFAFFPLAILYLLLCLRVVTKKSVPWKYLLTLVLSFIGLQSYHLIPLAGVLFTKNSDIGSRVFLSASMLKDGLFYFDANRIQLGKVSENYFQPVAWYGRSLIVLLIPVISVIGFILKKSRLLALTGLIFAFTYYLVSANITLLGIKLYRLLFYIPGFAMFRSFNDKWYWVFAFFFALMFAQSFSAIVSRINKMAAILLSLTIVVIFGIRIWPFFRGDFYNTTLYQSNNVSPVFSLDPDLLPSIRFIRSLPSDGNILTLPIAFPYYQVINGAKGGAYVGVSWVRLLGGKKDIPGFWLFRPQQKEAISIFQSGNTDQLAQLLSLYSIRYVFRNTDKKIFTNFPKFPFYRYDMTEDIPLIDSQETYDTFLRKQSLTKLYERGYFQVLKFDDSVVRPVMYVPDEVHASISGVLSSSSYRSAFVDGEPALLGKVSNVPSLTYSRMTSSDYAIRIRLNGISKPFLIVFSEDYSPWLRIKFSSSAVTARHVFVNGYANGWIIDPGFMGGTMIEGTLEQGFHVYFRIGWVISIATIAGIGVVGLWKGIKQL